MEASRIAELFERMRDPQEGINNFVYSQLLSTMVGRSLEAALPVMERAHGTMAAAPMTRYLVPGGPTTRTALAVECPEGPHGGTWRKAFLFEGADASYLTVLEVSGEPNPSIEDSLDKLLAARGIAVPEREHRPGPVEAVNVYAVRNDRDVQEALLDDSREKWRSDLIMETRASYARFAEPGEPERWMESRRNVVTGQGLSHWAAYFRDLRGLLGTLGLLPEMAASSAELQGRNWEDAGTRGGGMDDYAAASAIGAEAAFEDGHLPGANCLAALSSLDRLGAEAAMAEAAGDMVRLDEMLPRLVDAGGRFGCNDGRNEVEHHPGADGFGLRIADQNSLFDVAVTEASIRVRGARTNQGLRAQDSTPCFDVRFDRTAEGRWSMFGEIGQNGEAIRAWNGFKSSVATLACCAGEELDELPRNGRPGASL